MHFLFFFVYLIDRNRIALSDPFSRLFHSVLKSVFIFSDFAFGKTYVYDNCFIYNRCFDTILHIVLLHSRFIWSGMIYSIICKNIIKESIIFIIIILFLLTIKYNCSKLSEYIYSRWCGVWKMVLLRRTLSTRNSYDKFG